MNDSGVVPTFDHFAGAKPFYKVSFALLDGLGISGNIAVILTIFINRNMRASVYIMLCNLAVSDLLLAILAPFYFSSIMENYNWRFGATFCKIYFYSYCFVYTVSFFTVILITVQRFRATHYPVSFRLRSKRTGRLLLICWILSAISSSPFLSVMKHKSFGENHDSCFQQWPNKEFRRGYHIFQVTGLFLFPFLVMVTLYGIMFKTLRKPPIAHINETIKRQIKKRKKLSLIIGIIVLVFFACWTPLMMMDLLRAMDLMLGNPAGMATALNYSLLAVVLSTAFNPILLNFMCSEFRLGLKRVLRLGNCNN